MKIPEKFHRLFETRTYGYLATVTPKGLIQNHPMLIFREGDKVKISTEKSRQKYRNLKADPRATLLVMDPENPYSYIEIRGKVESMEDDINNAFIDSLCPRYFGTDRYEKDPPGAKRVTVTIKPEKIFTFPPGA
ncbi:MAG: PPOX class F420-dependent oxidoreductase [SAR324 cluster bacterium]|nr:PPOX class F420-dependent oxidoreductase [SAR324 cluster bacterium]